MKKPTKSLDDLETGIKRLLLENRCSFSEEEKVQLNDCLALIQQSRKKGNTDLIVKILEILCKLFVAADHVSEFFG